MRQTLTHQKTHRPACFTGGSTSARSLDGPVVGDTIKRATLWSPGVERRMKLVACGWSSASPTWRERTIRQYWMRQKSGMGTNCNMTPIRTPPSNVVHMTSCRFCSVWLRLGSAELSFDSEPRQRAQQASRPNDCPETGTPFGVHHLTKTRLLPICETYSPTMASCASRC